MINYSSALLDTVSCHYIGRHSENEGVKLSEHPIRVSDENLKEFLLKYLLGNFKEPEYFSFKSISESLEENPMYSMVSSVFEDPQRLHNESHSIAKFLYNSSNHPNIKSGDLLISKIDEIIIDDELVSALVIVKSEVKDFFLKMNQIHSGYSIDFDTGININKVDKACVIFNTEKEDGYKMCIIDKTNSGKEASFWRDDFVMAELRSDDYYKTKVYIQATKAFVNDRLKPMYELEKPDEAYILNASKNYMESKESFEEDSYLDSLFGDEEEVKKEFVNYKRDYESENEVSFFDSFEVSQAAVKNQAKVFKSVLKLDRNFHVYIHGDRSMIERGTDEMGRKFYKLYYDSES